MDRHGPGAWSGHLDLVEVIPSEGSDGSSGANGVQGPRPSEPIDHRCERCWSSSGSSRRPARVASPSPCRRGSVEGVLAGPLARHRLDTIVRACSGAPDLTHVDPEPIADPNIDIGRTLHDAAHPPRGRHEVARPHDPDIEDAKRAVETNHGDREPHPERVNRRCVRDPERLVLSKRGVSAEAACSFGPGVGDLASQARCPRTFQDDAVHLATLASAADIERVRGWRGGRAGFEPATRGLKAPCSNQLSYRPAAPESTAGTGTDLRGVPATEPPDERCPS